MKINVQVKTRSKIEGVEKIAENSYIVRVNVPPIEGKANKRIVELLSEHFDCPKSSVVLQKGTKSKMKIFEIGHL